MSQDKQARVPKSFKEASHLAMTGNWVDISPLVEVSTGKFQREQKDFQSHVQWAFDALTKTALSSEYSQFLGTVESELGHITGLTVVSDLEFVLVFRCDNEMYSDYKENPRYIYVLDPYFYHMYLTLMKAGNEFVFWTSALRFILKEIQAMLPDDIAGTPAICREDFAQILSTIVKHSDKEISKAKAIQELKRVCAPFAEGIYERGKALLTEQDYLGDVIKRQKDFPYWNKLPILFADPAQGVFIDDNIDYIKSAAAAGWPRERTIHADPGIFSMRRTREVIDEFRRIVPA